MRTRYFYVLAFLGLFLVLLQASCNPDDYGACDAEYYERTDNGYISFVLAQTGTNEEVIFLDVLRYPCDRDSVKVFSEDGELVDEYEFRADGRIAFRATNDDSIHALARTQEVSRLFQLYINYQEVHWIELRYRLRDVKCDYDVFDYIEIYYDDSLYSRSIDRIRIPSILIEQDFLGYNRCGN